MPHGILEQKPVFGLLDSFDLRANQLNAVSIKDSCFGERDGKVQAGLATYGGEQRIGPFAANDLFEQYSTAQRLDIGPVASSGSVMIVAGLELTRMTS